MMRVSPVWALVPVKRFDRAKSRLADVLPAEARAALAAAMLGDVLELLAEIEGIAGTLVVTADPAAAGLAAGHGAEILADRHESGINEAVVQGLRSLTRLGAGGALVIPGDVPFATSGEIAAVLHGLAGQGAVLVPATRDGGTNAVAIAPAHRLAPCFGPGSFVRHLATAASAGLTPAVLRLAGIGHDIDVPGDLALASHAAIGPAAARRTRDCLAQLQADPAAMLAPAGRRLQKVMP